MGLSLIFLRMRARNQIHGDHVPSRTSLNAQHKRPATKENSRLTAASSTQYQAKTSWRYGPRPSSLTFTQRLLHFPHACLRMFSAATRHSPSNIPTESHSMRACLTPVICLCVTKDARACRLCFSMQSLRIVTFLVCFVNASVSTFSIVPYTPVNCS
jgi:hypothetical protein